MLIKGVKNDILNLLKNLVSFFIFKIIEPDISEISYLDLNAQKGYQNLVAFLDF